MISSNYSQSKMKKLDASLHWTYISEDQLDPPATRLRTFIEEIKHVPLVSVQQAVLIGQQQAEKPLTIPRSLHTILRRPPMRSLPF